MSTFENMLFSDNLKTKMINIAMSKTFNKFDAEDLIQQTYLKALENQNQFSGNNIDAWVITILKNNFIDSMRKGTFRTKQITKDIDNNIKEETVRVKRESLYGDATPENIVNDESESLLLERDKNKCLKELSENEREIIALKQTSSYSEISIDLKIKPGTLRQTFSRAKEKFMNCMGFNDE